MGATTYEADSSHVPMLSKPSLVIDVIRTAAKDAMTHRFFNFSEPAVEIEPP
jgi:hypothetical protein